MKNHSNELQSVGSLLVIMLNYVLVVVSIVLLIVVIVMVIRSRWHISYTYFPSACSKLNCVMQLSLKYGTLHEGTEKKFAKTSLLASPCLSSTTSEHNRSRDRSWAHCALCSCPDSTQPQPAHPGQHQTRFYTVCLLTMGIMMPETCRVNLKWINIFTCVIRWFFLLLR